MSAKWVNAEYTAKFISIVEVEESATEEETIRYLNGRINNASRHRTYTSVRIPGSIQGEPDISCTGFSEA
jgi:hypothetical protein